MRMNWPRAIAAIVLLSGVLGCSGKPQDASQSSGGQGDAKGQAGQQDGQQGAGGAKAQSQGSSSALDQELKRQGDIYREYLLHNAEQARKAREEDKKLLEGMRKNEQESLQRQIRTLQRKQGLTDDTGQGQAGSDNKQSDQAGGGGDGEQGKNGGAQGGGGGK